MLKGKIMADGRLVLEGTGFYKGKGEPNWRYRFEGQFAGVNFSATGVMLATNRGTKLRDCSMELARVSASQQARQRAVHPSSGTNGVATAKSKITSNSSAWRTAAPEAEVMRRSMRTPSPTLELAPGSPQVGASAARSGEIQAETNAGSIAAEAKTGVIEQAPVAALAPQQPPDAILNRPPPSSMPGAYEKSRVRVFAGWLSALALLFVAAISIRKHMRSRAAGAPSEESRFYGFWPRRNTAVVGPNLITRAVAAAQKRARADEAPH
jgi:hypothetical protein